MSRKPVKKLQSTCLVWWMLLLVTACIPTTDVSTLVPATPAHDLSPPIETLASIPAPTRPVQPSIALNPLNMPSGIAAIAGWSPDGAWIGYRTGEGVIVQNINTDAICPLGRIMQSDPYSERFWAWQADGRVLMIDLERREVSAITPCKEERDRSIMEPLQGTIRQIASVSPDHHLFVMDTTQGYWIYSSSSGEVWKIELEEGTEAWGFVWSPQMTRLAVSVHLPARLRTQPPHPDSRTRTIDMATGAVLGDIEWVYWGGDPPRSPDWIDEERFLIASTGDKQGPLLVTSGEDTLGIPSALFGLDCETAQCQLTFVWQFAVQPGGSYHLILTDQQQPRQTRIQLYHSESGTVETFDGWSGAEFSSDGQWLLGYPASTMSDGRGLLLRPVDPVGAVLEAPDILYGQWLPDSSAMIVVQGPDVSLYRIPDGAPLARWHAEGYTLFFPLFSTIWSPDGREVLVLGEDHEGNHALFVLVMP